MPVMFSVCAKLLGGRRWINPLRVRAVWEDDGGDVILAVDAEIVAVDGDIHTLVATINEALNAAGGDSPNLEPADD